MKDYFSEVEKQLGKFTSLARVMDSLRRGQKSAAVADDPNTITMVEVAPGTFAAPTDPKPRTNRGATSLGQIFDELTLGAKGKR